MVKIIVGYRCLINSNVAVIHGHGTATISSFTEEEINKTVDAIHEAIKSDNKGKDISRPILTFITRLDG